MKARQRNGTPAALSRTSENDSRHLSAAPRARATREQLRAEISELRETLAIERFALEAEHRALLETQRDLEVSRDRYVDLYDFAPIGFATLDTAGSIKNLNITGARMLGREREFLLDKPMVTLVAKESRHQFFEHLAQARRSGREVTTELRFSTKQSGDILLEFTSILASRPTGGSRIRTAFRDVTQQRLAEHAPRAWPRLNSHSSPTSRR